MDNLIGKKLDGLYEVKELIGSGGMANVYKAVMLGRNGPVPAGTVVAVKVLRQEYTHDPELVRRFKNESRPFRCSTTPTSSRYTTFRSTTSCSISSWNMWTV